MTKPVEVDPTAPKELELPQSPNKVQTGLQREDGKIVHPHTGKELKQDLSKSKNIYAPK